MNKAAFAKMHEAIELARSHGDLPNLAAYMHLQGSALVRLRISDDAAQLFAQCLDIVRSIGEPHLLQVFFSSNLYYQAIASLKRKSYFIWVALMLKSLQNILRQV